MQRLFYCVFILSISSTLAVLLDGTCSSSNECEGSNVICQNSKCRCDTPLYTPCNSTCELNRRISYVGDRCTENDHCGEYMTCSGSKCVCQDSYLARNGLCYKSLEARCTNNRECWSNYCINSQCDCPAGYVRDNEQIGCRRKWVKIYETWEAARGSEAFCSDSSSCYDPIADCFNDTANPSNKFCKCPKGFRVTNQNEKCELIESPHFSPLTTRPTTYEECGTCKDDNAQCMTADVQTTCWCRAGYKNENGRCVSDRYQPPVIFPNDSDREKYDYTGACTTIFNETGRISNKLCTCSPGFRFISKDQKCEPIAPEWINDALEYGLCTRINSQATITQENGLCPSPLKCLERGDKYVCSCGDKQFLDIDNSTLCVYQINETTTSPLDLCPTKNAERHSSGVCQCLPGYQATNNRRQCKIQLSSNLFNNSVCSADRSNDRICISAYGSGALLCSTGECRCDGNRAFPNANQTYCYAPVNVTLPTGSTAQCPPLSTPQGSRCLCNAGYHTTDFRTCVRLPAQLVDYIGSPQSSSTNSLRDEDCKKLFTGPLQLYNGTHCQCLSTAFLKPDKTGCWYKLNISLPDPASTCDCPTNSERGVTDYCKCSNGYVQNGNACELLNIQLYEANTTAATNTTGLKEGDCIKLFGPAAQLSPQGSFCVCRDDSFVALNGKTCLYFINKNNTERKTTARCPNNSDVINQGSYYTCVCNPGYHPSSTFTSCEFSDIKLVGTLDLSATPSPSCKNYSLNDCMVKFGSAAVCHEEKCYCNRKTSYRSADDRCETYGNYVFPGLHEYQWHTCMTDKDCGDLENVECTLTMSSQGHRICQCITGSYLDPKSGKCEKNRCEPPCNTANNFECRSDLCVCKPGYIASGSTCVPNNYKLELNEPCNASVSVVAMVDAAKSDYLFCDVRCLRARCLPGYRSDGNNCVRYKLGKDSCVNRADVCNTITNAFCNPEKNHCSCQPGYYQIGDRCARAVNSRCNNDVDCDGDMRCEAKRCQCNPEQQVAEDEDVFGRPIQRCINNGVDPLRFSLVIITVIGCFRLLFL